uniref:Tgr11238C n=1 Tax=Dictyostelium purpureum TaxID=5786 RepID=A0A3S9KFY2_DICPU|nr:tgr11238C [Dictyostelium purpureum]
MKKLISILFLLTIQISIFSCLDIYSQGDKIDLVYLKDYEYLPINITLYKDTEFKLPFTIIYYNWKTYVQDNANFINVTSYSTNSSIYWGSRMKACAQSYAKNVTVCNFQSGDLYNALFRATNVTFLNRPSTRGGIVNITGEYMRCGCRDINQVYMTKPGTIYNEIVSLYVAGDPYDPNYNPNFLTTTIIPGFGKGKICFDFNKLQCAYVYYQQPTISSTLYDAQNQQLTIKGTNFYNVSNVAHILIDNQPIDSNGIASIDHEQIVLNYPFKYTQTLNLSVSIDILSVNQPFEIPPFPTSYSTTVTQYNEGIVVINGTNLISSSDQNNIVITVDDKPCTAIQPFDITSITCKLSNEGADTKQHQLKLCVNNICSLKNLVFEYAKPYISSITQNDTRFSVSGTSQGSAKYNSTVLEITYNTNQKITIVPDSISSDETIAQFTVPFFCGNASAQLIVNGVKSNQYQITPEPLIKPISPPSTDGKSPLNVLLYYYDCKYYNNKPVLKYLSMQVTGENINNTYSFNVKQGTGKKQALITFADQDIPVEYSYAKPLVSNHSVVFDDPLSTVTLNGNNFGTNSSLCNLTYKGAPKPCVVINNYQISFKIDVLEVSANIIITIDGIQSENYTMELVKCLLANDHSFPTSFGCLSSNPVVQYYCDSLTTFTANTDPYKLLHATFDDQSTNITINGNNVSIPVKEGAKNSTLKLYLNGLFSKSYSVVRDKGIVYDSKLSYNEDKGSISLEFNGMNFGTPLVINLPTLLNSSFGMDNCTLLYHGTDDNKNCTNDLITCQLTLPTDFNKTLLAQDENSNTTLSIPFSLKVGDSLINSTISNVEHSSNQNDNNKRTKTIALAVTLPIGLTLLTAGGVFGAWKYHQNKIDNKKKKNIESSDSNNFNNDEEKK